MKKTLLLIVIVVLLLSLISCGKGDDKTSGEDNRTKSSSSDTKQDETTTSLETDAVSSDLSVTSSAQKNVEAFTKQLINAADGTKIDSLTVTKAENSANGDNYKVYAIISWNRKHTASDSQQIIKDYSDSFASTIDTKLGNVQDLSLVWLVSNLNGTASITYEKVDGLLSLKEETYDKKFGITSEGTTNAAVQTNTGAAVQTNTGAAVNATESESVVNN
ncbi:MAG: hypothetical protein AB9836_13505 [Aminipila sp.]